MRVRENYIAFCTIIRKEVIRVMRIWVQTLLPSAITMTLYFVIFGAFIGSRVGEVGGVPYMSFLVPGLVMMAVITNAYSNVVSSWFGSKFIKSVQELLVSPVQNWIIVLGHVLGGVFRGLVVGALVILVSLFFTKIAIYNLFAVIVFVVLTSIVFSLGGFTNAMFAKKFDDVTIVPTFVLTPLIYLGGVFYSIASLPPFWQAVSKANPILYMVNGFRYGFLGISDTNVWFGLAMLIVFTVVFFLLNVYLLRKGVGMKS